MIHCRMKEMSGRGLNRLFDLDYLFTWDGALDIYKHCIWLHVGVRYNWGSHSDPKLIVIEVINDKCIFVSVAIQRIFLRSVSEETLKSSPIVVSDNEKIERCNKLLLSLKL